MMVKNKDFYKGKFYSSVVVGERGQIVIPKDARDDFSIKPGDRLMVVGKPSGTLVVMKVEAMRDLANKILARV